MKNEHTLEKSLTLYSRKGCERVVCERWVGDGTETATYWPHIPLTIAVLIPHSAGLLNRGPESPNPLSGAGSHYGILSATTTGTHCIELNSACLELQLTRTVCGTGLYNCLTFICFPWASQLPRFQPVHRSRWYLRPDAPVSWLTAGSRANMLHLIVFLSPCIPASLLGYISCPYLVDQPKLECLYVGVHKRTSLMISSLLRKSCSSYFNGLFDGRQVTI